MLGETAIRLTPRPTASSVEELLVGAEGRAAFQTAESRSTARFEQVTIDGERFVVKHLHLDDDFAMRASGDIGCRALRAWEAGLYDTAPHAIDHAIVGVARGEGRNGWGAAVLMRDAAGELVPPGDDPFPEAQHEQFITHLTALCASTWGWRDDLSLLPPAGRWAMFGPSSIEGERALSWPEPVPKIAAGGWEQFARRAPKAVADAITGLLQDPHPLAAALDGTPSCFLHGDWKASNLGTARDGRTVLLDWMYLGQGPACHELGWYLALNRAKLPAGRSKEDVIAEFRRGLEASGVDTAGWWDTQLRLCLLGTVLQFGWEKALGSDDELGWWCDRAADGLEAL